MFDPLFRWLESTAFSVWMRESTRCLRFQAFWPRIP